jgi:excisionase family DNA binding protein
MLTESIAFSRREAADALRVSLRTLDYLLAQGKLHGRRIGRRVVIPRAEVEKLLRKDTPIVQGIDNAS